MTIRSLLLLAASSTAALAGAMPREAALETAPAGPPSTHPAVRLMEFVHETAPYPQSHASTVAETRGGR